MAKHLMNAHQRHKHEKAFDLYAQGDANGQRLSNAALAQLVGVSASAIAYWKRRDDWSGKLLASIDQELADASAADLTNKNIRKLLRESLFNHIKALNTLIAFTKAPADKINAIKAFVHVAKELNCLDPEAGPGTNEQPPRFEDDLPHEPAQPPSEGTPGTGAPADGAGGPVGEPAAAVDLPDASVHPADVSAMSTAVGDDLERVFAKLDL